MDLLSNVLGGVWSYVIIFLLVLTLVVFIHELGHFLVARWCGVSVKAFSIGFGPEIFGFNDRHGTRWRFAWIPLGGYVKFMDDENAASKPSSPEALQRMTPQERAGSFHAKPVWQRSAVVAAGPIANFLLASVIYACLFSVYGIRILPASVEVVVPDSPAAAAGFLPGDNIVEVDGSSIDSIDQVQTRIDFAGARPMTFVVERDGKRVSLEVTPNVKEMEGPFGRSYNRADIGIRSTAPAKVGDVQPGMPAEQAGMKAGDLITAVGGIAVKAFEDIPPLLKDVRSAVQVSIERDGAPMTFEMTPVVKSMKDEAGNTTERVLIGIIRASPEPVPVSVPRAIVLGAKQTYETIATSLSGLNAIIAGRQSAEQMGGPILMAEVTARAAEAGIEALLGWVALISANIGFLNLLPIPVLDGGHLLFYGIEAVRRKPLSERVQHMGFQIGLAIIVGLMIFVNFNDLAIGVRRLFGAS